MSENVNYISDEELEQLILQVEQNGLVPAPPDLMENILAAAGLMEESEIVQIKPYTSTKKEFYMYCFRVITSVAAAVALTFLLPHMTDWMGEKTSLECIKAAYGQEAPDYEDVVGPVPSKKEVVTDKTAPSREEVLNDTGVVEQIIRKTGWFSKNNENK